MRGIWFSTRATGLLQGPSPAQAPSNTLAQPSLCKSAAIRYFYILCLKAASQTVLVSGPQGLNLHLKLVPQVLISVFGVSLTREFPVTHSTGRLACSLLQPRDPTIAFLWFESGEAQPRRVPRAPLSSTHNHPVTRKQSPGNSDLLQKHRGLIVFWVLLRRGKKHAA